MHSGTTLVQNILARHSSVFSARAETKYFEYLSLVSQRFSRLQDDQVARNLVVHILELVRYGYRLKAGARGRDEVASISPVELQALLAKTRARRDYGTVFEAVLDHLTRAAGKRRWLEKTPTHVFRAGTILRSIPDARFVEIVRDPRDVLASKKTRRETVWTTDRYQPDQRAWKDLEKAYDPLWDSLSWKATIRAGRTTRLQHGEVICTVRYEDLVSDPECHVRRLCDFLDMDFEPAMLDVPAGVPADWTSAQRRPRRGIATDALQRWRNVLSPGEIALCQWVAGCEMRRLEYPRHPCGAASKAMVVLLLVRSCLEFLERLDRRRRMGGARFLSVVLANYGRRLARMLTSR